MLAVVTVVTVVVNVMQFSSSLCFSTDVLNTPALVYQADQHFTHQHFSLEFLLPQKVAKYEYDAGDDGEEGHGEGDDAHYHQRIKLCHGSF